MKHHKCPHCNNVYIHKDDLYYKNRSSKKYNRTDILWKWFWILLLLSIIFLIVGMVGYYNYHHNDWVDALYNTTAIMSGVGAADTPNGREAQIFASFYTMTVGLFYIAIITVFIANIFIISNEDDGDEI